MRSWAGEFKQFLLRGNVVDLAVGIVIGAAFVAVVQALVRDFLTPLIAAIFGKPDFSRLSFMLHRSVFHYGDLLNYLIAFLTVAVALFFFVVKPINTLISHAHHDKPADPNTRKCRRASARSPSGRGGAPTAPPTCRRSPTPNRPHRSTRHAERPP